MKLRILFAVCALFLLCADASAGPIRDRLRARFGGSCSSSGSCAPACPQGSCSPAASCNSGACGVPMPAPQYVYPAGYPQFAPACSSGSCAVPQYMPSYAPQYLPSYSAPSCPGGNCPVPQRFVIPVK